MKRLRDNSMPTRLNKALSRIKNSTASQLARVRLLNYSDSKVMTKNTTEENPEEEVEVAVVAEVLPEVLLEKAATEVEEVNKL